MNHCMDCGHAECIPLDNSDVCALCQDGFPCAIEQAARAFVHTPLVGPVVGQQFVHQSWLERQLYGWGLLRFVIEMALGVFVFLPVMVVMLALHPIQPLMIDEWGEGHH